MTKQKSIPYGKQTITDKDIEAVVDVLKSDFITQGPKISEFESVVASYHQAKYGVAFSNGTAALHAAYQALNVKVGDEIITSPITFAASANAAVYCGGMPRFVDIDSKTNCIDIERLESAITETTKVITPVSLAGYPVDLKRVREIADRHGCAVIHDAAHAIGSKRDGDFGMKHVDMAMLSFHPVKHITTGEGGMILTNSKALYDKLILFRSHGITKEPDKLSKCDGPWYYEMISLGYNYRMTDIQAALGISQFSKINENLLDRNRLAKTYQEAFDESDLFESPPQIGFGLINDSKADNIHSYHLYTLQVKEEVSRLDFYNYLHDNGILAQIHYIPLYRQPYYLRLLNLNPEDYPESERYYKREVSIPMYHNMSELDQRYVIDKILDYRRK